MESLVGSSYHVTPRNTFLAEVHVTGHSLGGALALLCAAQLSLSLNSTDVRLLTFGLPLETFFFITLEHRVE